MEFNYEDSPEVQGLWDFSQELCSPTDPSTNETGSPMIQALYETPRMANLASGLLVMNVHSMPSLKPVSKRLRDESVYIPEGSPLKRSCSVIPNNIDSDSSTELDTMSGQFTDLSHQHSSHFHAASDLGRIADAEGGSLFMAKEPVQSKEAKPLTQNVSDNVPSFYESWFDPELCAADSSSHPADGFVDYIDESHIDLAQEGYHESSVPIYNLPHETPQFMSDSFPSFSYTPDVSYMTPPQGVYHHTYENSPAFVHHSHEAIPSWSQIYVVDEHSSHPHYGHASPMFAHVDSYSGSPYVASMYAPSPMMYAESPALGPGLSHGYDTCQADITKPPVSTRSGKPVTPRRASFASLNPAGALMLTPFMEEEEGKTSKYKCPRPGCYKSYKNSNGLKYHMDHGNCEIDPNLDEDLIAAAFETGGFKMQHRPYWCRVDGCGRRYKNLNGLKYHAKVSHAEMNFESIKGYAVVPS